MISGTINISGTRDLSLIFKKLSERLKAVGFPGTFGHFICSLVKLMKEMLCLHFFFQHGRLGNNSSHSKPEL